MPIKALLITLALITIWTDGRQHKIYNKVLLPYFLVALLIQPIISLEGAALGFLFLLLPYLFGGIGAGDVKLLAVYGALLGPHLIITAFFYGAIIGGVVAWYKRFKKEKTLAYGIPLSLGAMLTLAFPITVLRF
ncbi:MAG: prepilin peptidase [Desulfosporosinus sp.]|nr:prepilin peptidase [Desulfosporosinus sp.]